MTTTPYAIPPSPSKGRAKPKVAYMMSRFPALTETFVLYEIVAVQAQGIEVSLYPLQRERTDVMHPEARPLVAAAHYQPLLSWPVLRANLRFLLRQPRRYVTTLWDQLRATWGSQRYFAGTFVFWPKTVRFAEMMQAEGITHIHAHFASHPAASAFVIHRLTGIPYSFTAHGSDLHRDRHMLCEKTAEAAFVVTISEFNKRIFEETCGPSARDKVRVVYCGVDTQTFRPPQAQSGDEPGRPLDILQVGTLYEVKGQTHLIQACRLLREQGIPFTCRFVGDGPDEEMLAGQIAEAGLQEQVTLLGRKTREEVIALLTQADVLVAPSVPSRDNRREGLPVVLIEAMASGLPVVASDLSGIPELVEDGVTGCLAPPGDAPAIARALADLYHDPALRRRLAQAGREKVLQQFDLTTNAAALIQAFGEGTRA